MMRNKKIYSVIVLLALLAGCSSNAKVRNIVVIGWDGAQRDHVNEMLEGGELPVLAALSQEGGMVDIDVTDGATDTKAGWAQIFTGYSPAVTGVSSNLNYQPIPPGYTIFERAEQYFGPDNIDTVAVIGKKGNIGNAPTRRVPYQQWLNRTQNQQNQQTAAANTFQLPPAPAVVFQQNGRRFVSFPGQPWAHAAEYMDLFVNGLGTNQNVGTLALEELDHRKDRRLLMFIHFAQPDEAGHEYGENSPEYSEALKNDDQWTGRIIDKLKELGIYKKTLVYIVVDHGFNEGQKGHSYAPYVFLASNDPDLVRDGDRMDIAPTLLKRMGIDTDRLSPPLDGTPLDEPAERHPAPPEKPRLNNQRATAGQNEKPAE